MRNPTNGQQYSQTWKENMSVCEKASIKKSSSTKGFVRIEFVPDLTRFIGCDSKNMIEVLHTRAIEIAALAGKEVKVFWNDESIPTNTFEKFVHLFTKDAKSISYESAGPRWEVAAVLTKSLVDVDSGKDIPSPISFVNGIHTRKGGKHVDTISKQILASICEIAQKKKKLDVKPGQLKDTVTFFVAATIVNPAFDSQTKETLTTPASKFGSSPVFKGKLVDGLIKAGVLDEVQAIAEARDAKSAKKTDGKKQRTIRGLPKLEDAEWAGTAKSSECTLILTEGDSAKASAVAGLKVVGRDKWGVFPLRGKLLNVRDVSVAKTVENKELAEIKKILGLKDGAKYTSSKELRYGRIMIMSDQDVDGFHIRGLLMNIFHHCWPSLLKLGFICCLVTPLLKATKAKKVMSFYSQAEYDAWVAEAGAGADNRRGWQIKYYKGLGTSTPAEAREWFVDIKDIKYTWDDKTDQSINLAFSKSKADDRKEWLATYNSTHFLDPKEREISFTRFVNEELIHYSTADNIRSLPHMMDGLKPSQRKILWAALKKNLKSDIKVAQLAGYISEQAAYHHGETSLTGAITAMAQTFVGSNNLTLLSPVGQFGTRLLGGDDAASPRYIQTCLEEIVDVIFNKEDSVILNYLEEDGRKIEPDYYLPIVPLLIINGCVGIGTGFSTNIPPHHPLQVVELLKERLNGTVDILSGRRLDPWWFGFTGKIMREEAGQWSTHGIYTWNDDKMTVTIKELPIGTWTSKYKEFLDGLCLQEPPVLLDYSNGSNDVDVLFVLQMDRDRYYEARADPSAFEKQFQLIENHKTTNMVGFGVDGKIKKYITVGDIIEEYYGRRLAGYEERRQKQIEALEKEVIETDARVRFLRAVLEERIVLAKKSKEQVVTQLRKEKLPALSSDNNIDDYKSYDYLLRLRIDSITMEAVLAAEKELADLLARLAILRATTAGAMWLTELGKFEKVWATYVAARVMAAGAIGTVDEIAPKKKRRSAVVKN